MGLLERLVEFWEYLSTQPYVNNIPYLTSYWDSSSSSINKTKYSGESAEDISALTNLFLRNLLTYLYQNTCV